MATVRSSPKTMIGWSMLALVGFLGLSYRSEALKHGFAPAVIDTMSKVPGTRLINSFKSGDLINPISWFWPTTVRMVYARPDIVAPDLRFYIMSFGIDEKKPSIWLASIDCAGRKEHDYFPAEKGDSGEPARNVLGEPVHAPDGSIFLEHQSNIPPAPSALDALCKTDWTAERKAVAAGQGIG